MDLGRLPEARYQGEFGAKYLRNTEVRLVNAINMDWIFNTILSIPHWVSQVSLEELELAQNAVGDFGGDNRAGIEGTLHRISAIRSRKGSVVGLTCRVGRAVSGHVDMVYDLLHFGQSILFVGR